MPINVWIAQTTAVKTEVEAIKGGATAKDAIKGTRAEQRAYAEVASKIADKVDGLFSRPRIGIRNMNLESLYLESTDEIAALEKGGATILGAWEWGGRRIEGYDLHPDLIKYMPIRKTYAIDANGETVETGTLPPVLEDVVGVWGQAPRNFGPQLPLDNP